MTRYCSEKFLSAVCTIFAWAIFLAFSHDAALFLLLPTSAVREYFEPLLRYGELTHANGNTVLSCSVYQHSG